MSEINDTLEEMSHLWLKLVDLIMEDESDGESE